MLHNFSTKGIYQMHTSLCKTTIVPMPSWTCWVFKGSTDYSNVLSYIKANTGSENSETQGSWSNWGWLLGRGAIHRFPPWLSWIWFWKLTWIPWLPPFPGPLLGPNKWCSHQDTIFLLHVHGVDTVSCRWLGRQASACGRESIFFLMPKTYLCYPVSL